MNSETIEAIKPWLNFIHPTLMWGIFALTLYAAYLGYQHRQTRLATGQEKKELIKGKFFGPPSPGWRCFAGGDGAW